MADILIKNIGGLPEDGDLTLTITPKGEIILGGCIFTHNFGKEVKAVALPSHGDLIDRGLVQEVLAQLLPLVITNELTDKEIGLVHRTVGAIAEMINEQEVVVEATE